MANSERDNFRQKTPEQLVSQVNMVNEDIGQSIIPPSVTSEVLYASPQSLVKQYPFRYNVYLTALRGQEIEPETLRRLHALNALDSYIARHHSNDLNRTLYEPQLTVFEDWRNFLEQGGTEGYIKLPTGSGKTVLFTEFVEATGHKTLVVTPTMLLVNQTAQAFSRFAPQTPTGKYYSYDKDLHQLVTVTTYTSLVNGIDKGVINPDDYDLLILDEAHKALSSTRIETIKRFTAALKIGFTATDKYSEEKQVASLLSTKIHEMKIKEGVELGLLSPLSVLLAQTSIDLSNIHILSNREYVQYELEKAINVQSRNQAAVEIYQKLFPGQIAIVYCVTISHAQDVTDLFNQSGVPAALVKGNQPPTEQREVLNKFRKGEIKVICNADVLIEGFDEPSAAVCLNLRPTSSPVLAEQRAGRVLRLDPNNPNKHAYIVDFLDQDYRYYFPITFAQIIGGASIYRSELNSQTGQLTGSNLPRYPQIEISGMKVYTEAEEVMQIVRDLNDLNAQSVHILPEGWLALEAAAVKANSSPRVVKQLIERYQFHETHPEWFKRYFINKVDNRGYYEYLAPELIENISTLLTQMGEEVPVGWIAEISLARTLMTPVYSLRKISAKYHQAQPEWIRTYRRGLQISDYYSPELITLVTRELEAQRASYPPKDWLSLSKLIHKTHSSKKVLDPILAELSLQYPDLIRQYKSPRMEGIFPYVSPTLVDTINSMIQHAPSDWQTVASLATEFHSAVSGVTEMAAPYLVQHPEWMRSYYLTGKIVKYYSPELTSILKNIHSNLLAPQDWMTIAQLAKDMHTSEKTLKEFLGRYQEEYPEWIKEYKNKRNFSKYSKYLSPELIDMLREEVRQYRDLPPPGWTTLTSLRKELRSSDETMRSLADKYLAKHPEWERPYKAGGVNYFKHVSPELAQLIREEISRRRKKAN